MILLITVAVLWAVFVTAMFRTETASRSTRAVLLGILLVYGVGAIASLAHSYLACSRPYSEYEVKSAISRVRMASLLADQPDAVASSEMVMAADSLLDRLDVLAGGFGPSRWSVAWRGKVFPAFRVGNDAANLHALADVPPLMVSAAVSELALRRSVDPCLGFVGVPGRLSAGKSTGFVGLMLDEGSNAHAAVVDLARKVDPSVGERTDPRTKTYQISMMAKRLIGVLAKTGAVLSLVCQQYDEPLTLRVMRREEAADAGDGWYPLNPLFMDLEHLLGARSGLDMLDVRWVGDPERPILGSIDAPYRIEARVRGAWPGRVLEGTTDDQSRHHIEFNVGVIAYELYSEGVVVTKPAGDSELRSTGLGGHFRNHYVNGFPLYEVREGQLFPNGETVEP